MTIKITNDLTQIDYPRYDSYKDSGVDWLGDVPQEWAVERLGVLLKEVSEKQHPDLRLLSITRERGVIERDIEDMDSNHNFIPDDLSGYKKVEKGQFGMNKMKAWQGSYGVSPYTGIVSPAYYIFDIHPDINKNFFSLAIRSKLYVSYFGSASDGVRIGQWDLNKTRMRQIRFVIPTLEEQKKIVSFLDKKMVQIDQAITLKQQQITKLEEYKQIVIQNAVTKGLNPDAPMKDSGVDWIGDIPEHWEVKKLKYLGKISSGYSVINSDLKDSGLYEAFGGNGFIGYYNKYNTEGQSIIVGRVGALCGNIRFINDKKWISDNALILKLNNSLLYEHIALVLKAADLNKLNTSNAQPLITGTKVMNVEIPKPTMNEIDLIDSYIKNFLLLHQNTLSNYKAQIDRLKEYKTILINQAVTGKIKIS
ncbi:restriction endonuclease subunit S [Psychrobacter celer]|uniref:restriction endonuclease subunit S n=1 Tax=Psychrobacter celer TaxID=306572 RepID=UPI003FD27ABB